MTRLKTQDENNKLYQNGRVYSRFSFAYPSVISISIKILQYCIWHRQTDYERVRPHSDTDRSAKHESSNGSLVILFKSGDDLSTKSEGGKTIGMSIECVPVYRQAKKLWPKCIIDLARARGTIFSTALSATCLMFSVLFPWVISELYAAHSNCLQ